MIKPSAVVSIRHYLLLPQSEQTNMICVTRCLAGSEIFMLLMAGLLQLTAAAEYMHCEHTDDMDNVS